MATSNSIDNICLEPRYCIVWEDPQQPDTPSKTTVPATKWLWNQLQGGLSEQEAMEHLLVKDVPERIWNPAVKHNRQFLYLCRRNQLPKTRRWRNAWRLVL